MSEAPELEHFKKNMSPEMSNFFLYRKKKWVFQAHLRVPPTTGVVELWKKKLFRHENQSNLGSVPEKVDEYFPWDLYSMYVVLQGI